MLKHICLTIGVAIAFMLSSPPCPAYQPESADVVLYKAAFQSYQDHQYEAAAQKLRLLLQRFPDTPLRDVATFWLARSSFHAGDRAQAARYINVFFRDYPDNPLWETAEKELLLLGLTRREDSGFFPEPVSDHVAETIDHPSVAEVSASEALHQAELQRSEQQAQAKIQADPQERRLAAERKIQQVRDALRRSEGKRLFRENQGG